MGIDVYEPPRLPPPPRPRREPVTHPPRWWLHLTLFVLTFCSAVLASVVPTLYAGSLSEVLEILRLEPLLLLHGLPFAVALMAVLLAHELGHTVMARRLGVDLSLPYFIPAPTLFGTLGAIILMRSLPHDRPALLKVAVAGPFAGMLLALPLLAWGLSRSAAADLDQLAASDFVFGSSLLFAGLKALFAPDAEILKLHPVALAGWVGLFQTSLNLIPAAQLDGGHVAYALFGRRHERLSRVTAALLLALGIYLAIEQGIEHGAVWALWAMLLYMLGLRHPPVQDERVPVSRRQKLAGLLAFLLLVCTFTPVPVSRALPPAATPTIHRGDQPRPMFPPRRRPLRPPPEEFRL
ncbi:MAG: site-2 protease family protein [Deltaproteobacteria bacterium]|nr:site-2 protease family protein [Deltaproteobacteria bacterium]